MRKIILVIGMALCVISYGQQRQRPWLKAIEDRMSDDEIEMLKAIYAPTIVATPLEDARRSVCVMPDGEIRCYGSVQRTETSPKGKAAYLSSIDGGLTWKLYYSRGNMGAATYIPEKGIFVTSTTDAEGTWFLISKVGPEDPDPVRVKVSSYKFSDCFQPTKS
ncbi:MAG: hypothetical protein IJK32_08400, partial [Bacteroidales bacterium]|nr:hypothetical protein [Bacteroidales bacterium]